MYRIGDFSKLSKTTVKTLRYYDGVGLLKPAFVDGRSGYRYYTTEQLPILHRIVSLRQAGLSIEEVARAASGSGLREILLKRRAEVLDEWNAAAARLSRIDAILRFEEEDLPMRYQAIVKQIPEYTVYYKRGVVPSSDDLGAFIVGSADECRSANPFIRCVEPDYCFVTYLDPEHKERDIGIEYAQAVQKAGVPVGDIGFCVLPAAKVVSVVHKGPYEDLGEAYAFALQWLADNGLRQAGDIREQYIDGVWNQSDPGEYLTEIQIPIEA